VPLLISYQKAWMYEEKVKGMDDELLKKVRGVMWTRSFGGYETTEVMCRLQR